MYLKILLHYLGLNPLCYILSFVIKCVASHELKIRSINSKFNFKLIFPSNIKFSVGLHIKTECTRIMNMVFQNKIMIMKKSSFSSAFNL